jgi:uncharacterized membrane protein
MLQLAFLLGLILITYALTGFWRGASKSFRGRISAAVFFLFTGIGHFFKTAEMEQMLPSFVPLRTEIIYVTGVLEILGAIGLLVAPFQRIAAWALILFLIGVLPANIYSAFSHVDFGGHQLGPIYLLMRIPFQLFVIGWIYYFGIRSGNQRAVKSTNSYAK